jgi:hypothetical protein
LAAQVARSAQQGKVLTDALFNVSIAHSSMQTNFGDAQILCEGHDAALLVASQLRVDRQTAQAEPGGELGDPETISDYVEHGAVTLFHFG